MEDHAMTGMLDGFVLMPLLIGGLVGTVSSLGFPVFIALVVTKVNVKASITAFGMWVGFIGLAMVLAWGGDVYHAFNAALASLAASSFIAVPVIAFILSRVPPFAKAEEPENPNEYIFGQDAYRQHTLQRRHVEERKAWPVRLDRTPGSGHLLCSTNGERP